MAKKKCLKKLVEGRQIVPGQQAQSKRELIANGGANHRESPMMFKRRAGPRYIIIITIVLYSAPSRLPTQKRSQSSLGQT